MRALRVRRAIGILGAVALMVLGAPRAEAAAAPIGNFESITAHFNGIKVRGWALDPDTNASIDVHVYVNNALVGAKRADLPRPDVQAAYNKGANHGFDFYVPSPGGTVCVYAINFGTGSPNTRIGCKSFPATAQPRGHFDATTPEHNGIRVHGWALDPDTSASIDVHVYVNNKLAAAGTANLNRPDLVQFGKGALHGFNLYVPTSGGRVCIYALNFGGGVNPVIGCKDVPASAAPIGNIDQLTRTSPTQVWAYGWARDPDTTQSIGVHVYFNEKLVASAIANQPRPDVDSTHHHGFTINNIPASGPGVVCIFALNYGGGYNTLLGCRQV